MTLKEFLDLKPDDVVIDSHGKEARVFDINKGMRTLRTYNDSWRGFEHFTIIKKKRGKK